MEQIQTLSAGPDLRLGKELLIPTGRKIAWQSGIRGCSRNRRGAYLLCSESLPSSLIGALMIVSNALVSDQIYFLFALLTDQDAETWVKV